MLGARQLKQDTNKYRSLGSLEDRKWRMLVTVMDDNRVSRSTSGLTVDKDIKASPSTATLCSVSAITPYALLPRIGTFEARSIMSKTTGTHPSSSLTVY